MRDVAKGFVPCIGFGVLQTSHLTHFLCHQTERKERCFYCTGVLKLGLWWCLVNANTTIVTWGYQAQMPQPGRDVQLLVCYPVRTILVDLCCSTHHSTTLLKGRWIMIVPLHFSGKVCHKHWPNGLLVNNLKDLQYIKTLPYRWCLCIACIYTTSKSRSGQFFSCNEVLFR